MSFEEWRRKYETEYRGYIIRPGVVRKVGEPEIIFFSPIDASPEEVAAAGRRHVDELIAKKSSSSTTSTTPPA